MSPQKVWFVNFSGIGNGIMIIPVLACFEKTFPETTYFHTYNDIFADNWFLGKGGLKNLIGLSEIGWRRFKKEDWLNILNFIKEKHIDLIVNLRNEGPHCDIDYYAFKEYASFSNLNLNFWDLNFEEIENRKIQENYIKDVLRMMDTNGVDVSNYNNHWLESLRKPKDCISGIGLCITASQNNKRWPKAKWSSLIRYLLSKSFGQKIIIFPGKSKFEQEEANELCYGNLNNCSFVIRNSLREITEEISCLKCLISNDTGLLHIAASLNVPIVGIYTNTDPAVWGPYEHHDFIYFINNYMYRCPHRKIHCGNCLNYYDICPAIEKYGDDINPIEVLKAVETCIID